ncbi:hypothetical protein JCM1841_002838 [Sporobolomyces salmonicolor]
MKRKHVCILPDCVALTAADPSSSSSRFLRLPHPRTHQPALFLPYAREPGASTSDGLLEVQKVALEADKQRAWFIEQEVASDGSVSIFSPFDPVFLVLAYLSVLPSHFVSYSDLWDTIAQHRFTPPSAGPARQEEDEAEGDEDAPFADDLLRLGQLECVKERLKTVCEVQEHESTSLYRLSQSLVLDLLKLKIDALVSSTDGIFGVLESTDPGEKAPAKAGEENSPPVESSVRPFPTVSRGLGREGIGSGQGLSDEIQLETRQKYAIGILSNYLPPALAHTLLSAYSFASLNAHLATTNTSSVLGTTYLPGRGSAKLEAEVSLGGGAAAKKRKAETKGSRGVEALKKVNTKGMKSLAEMFGKPPAAKKVKK